MPSSLRRILVLHFALVLLAGCGSDHSPAEDDGGSAGAGSSSGGVSAAHAQLRFLYRADWKDHLGACASISDYRIKFGAVPLPITAPIDVTPDALSQYVEVEGRTYEDSDVLHIFTCSKSQTSKQTQQLYGKFGVDLPLEPAKRYTVTLSGSAVILAEDP